MELVEQNKVKASLMYCHTSKQEEAIYNATQNI